MTVRKGAEMAAQKGVDMVAQRKSEIVANDGEKFMKAAYKQALVALKKDEVPIGAVIVKDGKIIARGHNSRQEQQNPVMHAEVKAIVAAAKKLKSWRLEGCEMFVTLEPCPMCAGAIVNARLDKVTFACKEKTSSDNLCEKILSSNRLNHKTAFEQDFTWEEKCSSLLSDFFKSKRSAQE